MTNSEKIIVLNKTKSKIKTGFCFGICAALFYSLKDLDYISVRKIMDVYFYPYLLKYKPKKAEEQSFWWPTNDKETRYKVIDSIIKDLENE